MLSLPVPKSGNDLGEEVNNLACRNMPDYLEQRILQKLLLVGCDGSGTSTIFKQVLPSCKRCRYSIYFLFIFVKVWFVFSF